MLKRKTFECLIHMKKTGSGSRCITTKCRHREHLVLVMDDHSVTLDKCSLLDATMVVQVTRNYAIKNHPALPHSDIIDLYLTRDLKLRATTYIRELLSP